MSISYRRQKGARVDPAKFSDQAPGEFVRTSGGFYAFVPEPAPRILNLSPSAIVHLNRAAHALGILDGVARRLPDARLLIAPYIRREAVLSSRIEGTQASMADIYADEADQPEFIHASDVAEIRNYIRAYEDGLAALDRIPLSLRLIRDAHKHLMKGVRGNNRHPGAFRTYQNWIGGPTGDEAVYVPPPVPQMKTLLDDFEHYLHDESLPTLVHVAVIHHQFESIHPFGDGNGRVGRLLISLYLHARELLTQPLLFLSGYFEETRAQYYDSLHRVHTHGDWDGWISYFLFGIAEQSKKAAELADRIFDLRSDYRSRMQRARVSSSTLTVVNDLFVNPLVTVRHIQNLTGVSQPTAQKIIRDLESQDIINEISGRSWRTVYRADEIYDLLSGSGNATS